MESKSINFGIALLVVMSMIAIYFDLIFEPDETMDVEILGPEIVEFEQSGRIELKFKFAPKYSRVEYYADNERVFVNNDFPFSFTVTRKNIQDGEYQIVAKAIDRRGNWVLTEPITLRFGNWNQSNVTQENTN